MSAPLDCNQLEKPFLSRARIPLTFQEKSLRCFCVTTVRKVLTLLSGSMLLIDVRHKNSHPGQQIRPTIPRVAG
jgi:hypothetical protein